MKQIFSYILFIIIAFSAFACACSETVNPFTMREQSVVAARALNQQSSEADSIVIPVPPEILIVRDRAVLTGWEFLVSVKFNYQKVIGSSGFSTLEMQDANRANRMTSIFTNEIEPIDFEDDSILNRTKYNMSCLSGCEGNTSLWKLIIPYDQLPSLDSVVGYVVVVVDEYGNIATEIPMLLESYEGYDSRNNEKSWEYFDKNLYATPKIDETSDFTLTDEEDSLKKKADITGLRAAISEDKVFVEASFAENPSENFEGSDDGIVYLYSLNIFSSNANKGSHFDGLGQMIETMALPRINQYIDCGMVMSANDGACYLGVSGADSLFTSQCSIESSSGFSTDRMSGYFYQNRVAFQFNKDLFEEITKENFPVDEGYVTLIMSVPIYDINDATPNPKLYDISQGMNLYPQTHSFIVSENSYGTATVQVECGWNLLFLGNNWEPSSGEFIQSVGWNQFEVSNNTYSINAEETDSELTFRGLWYYSDIATNTVFIYQITEYEPYANISITPGWNIIGYNLSTSSTWNDEQVSIVCSGEPLSISQAVDAGIIGNSLYYYENGNYKKLMYGENLEHGRGYFLHANQECAISINSI